MRMFIDATRTEIIEAIIMGLKKVEEHTGTYDSRLGNFRAELVASALKVSGLRVIRSD